MSEINSVCVLTNYRTGSTSFTLIKAEEYDLPYAGEVYSIERPWPIGNVMSSWQEKDINTRRKKEGLDVIRFPAADHAELLTQELEKGEKACFKLMPNQLRNKLENEDPDYIKRIATACDKIYVLYRRDFKAQALSWIGMRMSAGTDGWGKVGFKKDRTLDWRLIDKHRNAHLATSPDRLAERVIRQVETKPGEQRYELFIKYRIEELIKNYQVLAELYKEFPNAELVCMEDYFAQTDYMKYNHEFEWNPGPPEIPDFDVEGLFR